MATYAVVAFREGDPRAESNWLLNEGHLFVVASNRRMAGKDPLPPHEHVEVFAMPERPPEAQRVELEALGLWFEPADAYREYAKVYFLNDAALRMFRDNGIELPSLETVGEDEVPSRHGPSLSSPYLFLDSANRSQSPEAEPRRVWQFPPELLARMQPPKAPHRGVGLPAHGLDLEVSIDGASVVLENRTEVGVAAYHLAKLTRWSDGTEERGGEQFIHDGALRSAGRNVDGGAVPAGASAPLGGAQAGIGAYVGGVRSGLGAAEPPTVVEVVVVLDAVTFADGTFVGSNDTGFFDELKAHYDAIRDLGAELLAAQDRGVDPATTFDELVAIVGDESYRYNRVPRPDRPEELYEYERRRQALQLLNMWHAVGPRGVFAEAAALVATTPRLRRRTDA